MSQESRQPWKEVTGEHLEHHKPGSTGNLFIINLMAGFKSVQFMKIHQAILEIHKKCFNAFFLKKMFTSHSQGVQAWLYHIYE